MAYRDRFSKGAPMNSLRRVPLALLLCAVPCLAAAAEVDPADPKYDALRKACAGVGHWGSKAAYASYWNGSETVESLQKVLEAAKGCLAERQALLAAGVDSYGQVRIDGFLSKDPADAKAWTGSLDEVRILAGKASGWAWDAVNGARLHWSAVGSDKLRRFEHTAQMKEIAAACVAAAAEAVAAAPSMPKDFAFAKWAEDGLAPPRQVEWTFCDRLKTVSASNEKEMPAGKKQVRIDLRTNKPTTDDAPALPAGPPTEAAKAAAKEAAAAAVTARSADGLDPVRDACKGVGMYWHSSKRDALQRMDAAARAALRAKALACRAAVVAAADGGADRAKEFEVASFVPGGRSEGDGEAKRWFGNLESAAKGADWVFSRLVLVEGGDPNMGNAVLVAQDGLKYADSNDAYEVLSRAEGLGKTAQACLALLDKAVAERAPPDLVFWMSDERSKSLSAALGDCQRLKRTVEALELMRKMPKEPARVLNAAAYGLERINARPNWMLADLGMGLDAAPVCAQLVDMLMARGVDPHLVVGVEKQYVKESARFRLGEYKEKVCVPLSTAVAKMTAKVKAQEAAAAKKAAAEAAKAAKEWAEFAKKNPAEAKFISDCFAKYRWTYQDCRGWGYGCVDLASDEHCGQCGNKCKPGLHCQHMQCQ